MSKKTALKTTEKPPYKKIEYEDDEPVKTMEKLCPAPIQRERCPASRCTCLVAFGCQLCGRRFCGTCIGGITQYCMRTPANDKEKKHVPLPICSDCNHTKTGGAHAHDDHEILAKCINYCCGGHSVAVADQQ